MTSRQGTFPIHFPEELLRDNPQFSHLLTRLSEKVMSDGVSQHMQRHLDLAHQNILQARYTWLMSSIILNELKELVADIEVRCQEGTVSPDERQLKDVLSKTLSFSEISDCLTILPSTAASSSLFGLSEVFVEKYNPVKHLLMDVQQIALAKLENKLRKKCEELYNFFDPGKNHDSLSDHLLVAISQSLPAFVEQKKRDLVQQTESLKQDRSQRDKQFWIHYQKLLESLSVMETLVKEFKLTRQAEMDNITVEWLQDKSDALCMKIRLTQLQILCDTYTVETVKALKKIGDQLDNATKQTERELASTSQALDAYHVIGTDFQLLVEQFTQLQQDIENRKWGLQQLAH